MMNGGFQALDGLQIRRGLGVSSWWLAGGISASNCVAAYQPKGAADYAASKVNLANPGTYNATEGNAPDWDTSYGWSFVKANSDYLNTGYSGIGGMSLIVRFSDYNYALSTHQAFFIGCKAYTTAWEGMGICTHQYGENYYLFEHANNYSTDYKPGTNTGVIALCNKTGYWNGSAVKTISSSGAVSGAVRIAKGYEPTQFVTTKIQAAAIYSVTLTESQVAALSTAMAAL